MGIAGFVWDESNPIPTFTKSRWIKSPSPYSIRNFYPGLSYELPIQYQGMIGNGEIKRYNLRPGDFITRQNGFGSMKIDSINGYTTEEWMKKWPKGTPEWSELLNQPDSFVQLIPGSQSLAILTEALLPQQNGTAILIAGEAASRKSNLTKSFLWSLDPNRYIVMYVFLERSNEVPIVAEVDNLTKLPQLRFLPPYAELWSFPFEHHVVEKELVAYVNFAAEVSKRRVTAGKDVIVLVDSIEVFAKAINTVTPEDGKTLSGGLVRSALTALRTWISAAKKPPIEGVGSLTFICLYRTNKDDKGTSSLETEIRGVTQGHIYMRGANSIPCDSFPVDLSLSKTRNPETILGDEGADKVWAFQKAVMAKERQAYLEVTRNERTYTNEQRDAARISAGVRIEPFYRQLRDNCARTVSLEDIWNHWPEILSGSYPPPLKDFGPSTESAVSSVPETKAPVYKEVIPVTVVPPTPPPPPLKAVDDKTLAAVTGLAGGQKGNNKKRAMEEQLGIP